MFVSSWRPGQRSIGRQEMLHWGDRRVISKYDISLEPNVELFLAVSVILQHEQGCSIRNLIFEIDESLFQLTSNNKSKFVRDHIRISDAYFLPPFLQNIFTSVSSFLRILCVLIVKHKFH